MASPSLSLPGVLFVGEDERARLVAHLGPAAGWMVPKGILGWSHEVSVVARDALGEQIRRDAKIVMPDEQIPQAKMPLTHQAALKSPLVAISGKLTQKLIDAGIRVHTVGADRITSSFYYIAEGGGEAPVRVEGDLVAAVGAMLGDRADNAAIERVLDGLVDRLLRSLSKDRVAELSLELAAALPRAAADGTGTHNVDLDSFERELAKLVAASEKYTPFLEEIAAKIGDTNERRVEVPLYGDARKISQGPFELTVGEQKVALVTHERWLATGPLTEPTAPPARAAAQKTPEPKPAPKAAEPKPAPKAAEPKPAPKAAEPKPAPKASEPKPITPTPSPAATPRTASSSNLKPVAGPPRPGSTPPPPASQKEPPKETPAEPALPKLEPAPVVILGGAPEPKVEPPPPEPAPTQQSVVSESPKPTPVAAAGIPKGTLLMASAPAPVAAKVADAVVPTPAPTPAPTPKPVPTPAPSSAESLPAVDAHDEDSRLANTQKTKRKEKGGGIPWVLILVILAAVVAGYRFLIAR